MTLPEFARLGKEEQINVIKKSGMFLFVRQEAGIDVVLYQIRGFYAEVFFDGGNRKDIRIRSFDDPASLDVYLQQISLDGLLHLL